MKYKPLYFDAWLKKQLKSPRFKKGFEEEDLKLRLAVRIAELRKKKRLSQAGLAKKLHTTQ